MRSARVRPFGMGAWLTHKTRCCRGLNIQIIKMFIPCINPVNFAVTHFVLVYNITINSQPSGVCHGGYELGVCIHSWLWGQESSCIWLLHEVVNTAHDIRQWTMVCELTLTSVTTDNIVFRCYLRPCLFAQHTSAVLNSNARPSVPLADFATLRHVLHWSRSSGHVHSMRDHSRDFHLTRVNSRLPAGGRWMSMLDEVDADEQRSRRVSSPQTDLDKSK